MVIISSNENLIEMKGEELKLNVISFEIKVKRVPVGSNDNVECNNHNRIINDIYSKVIQLLRFLQAAARGANEINFA